MIKESRIKSFEGIAPQKEAISVGNYFSSRYVGGKEKLERRTSDSPLYLFFSVGSFFLGSVHRGENRVGIEMGLDGRGCWQKVHRSNRV